MYAGPSELSRPRRSVFQTPTRAENTATPASRGEERIAFSTFIRGEEQSIDPVLPWWADVVERLVELRNLPPNWDGYGAEPLSVDAATRAAGFLAAVAMSFKGAPEPFIAPIHEGVQIEWDGPDYAIEIELRRNANRLVIESGGKTVYAGGLTEGLALLHSTLTSGG